LNPEDREQLMGKDPAVHFRFSSFDWPPTHGLGSKKQAWLRCSLRLGEINHALSKLVDQQSKVIAYLNAKVAQLHLRLAERKPKGRR
jgi:hypothetical protein